MWDGKSIFDKERPSLRVAVLHNGADTPQEFSIFKDDLSMHARLVDQERLEIVHLEGALQAETLNPLLDETR
jgi:hypothetical protein